MLLHVIARGKIGRSPEAELVERYARRIAWPLTLTELPEKGGSVPPPLAPGREVLLDERGMIRAKGLINSREHLESLLNKYQFFV